MPILTIPDSVRQGVLTTPTVIAPSGHTQASVTVTGASQAERDDVANRIDLAIEYSADGVRFKPYVMAGWRGGLGITSKDGTISNPLPSVTLAGPLLATLATYLVRVRLEMAQPMTIGAILSVT